MTGECKVCGEPDGAFGEMQLHAAGHAIRGELADVAEPTPEFVQQMFDATSRHIAIYVPPPWEDYNRGLFTGPHL
jgi:hypothetical protein